MTRQYSPLIFPAFALCLAISLLACSRADSANTAMKVDATRPASSPANEVAVADPTPAPTPEPVVQINKEPKTLVEAFYEFYLADDHPVMQGNERIFANFLTPKFYDAAMAEDLEDPFFGVPEFAGGYKDLKFSPAVIKGDKATVNVTAKAQSATWIVKVSLVKKNGTWKIDGVSYDLKKYVDKARG